MASAELDLSLGGDGGSVDSSLNDDLDALKRAFLNEKMAPEILPYDEDLVESMTEQLVKQQCIIEEECEDASEKFAVGLYQMEVDRVKYLLASYLRTRLRKIEEYALFILRDPELRARLSAREVRFAERFVQLSHEHLEGSALRHIPEKFRGLEEQSRDVDMIPRPDLDVYVFCVANQDIGGVQTGFGPPIEVRRQDAYVMRYSIIRKYVHDNSVDLFG